MANGNYFDRQGRLVTCEHSTSRVSRTELDGTVVTLASHYDGKELNSPNDVTIASDGTIYFSDPSYGRMDYYGVLRDEEMPFRGVYRIDPVSDDLTLIASDFTQPNGICLSLDESRLFVNDTSEGHIRVFQISTDGAVSGGAIWADVTGTGDGAPDGMKTDSAGNVYTTGPGGIHVFAPDRTDLGVIHVPEGPANFTWGGEGLRSLFITATSSLYRTTVIIPGKKLF
jgi:gluconolactonase